MNDYIDALYAERFRRSPWWETSDREHAEQARRVADANGDDDLTRARRRRDLVDEAYGEAG